MMQTMRNSAKIIFFIVLVAFVGFMVWGGVVSIMGKNRAQRGAAPPGVIGIVNGTQLSNYSFDEMYRKRIQSLTKDDAEPTDADMEKARNDIWNNLVSMTLIQQEADKHGIVVTDEEVAEYMRYSPPKDIVQSPDFATNGQFDIAKYQTWLQRLASSADPRAMGIVSDMDSQIRQQLLVSRVHDLVNSMERVSETDVRNDYIEKNDKAKVQYIFIPGGEFDSTLTSVPESEVKTRYERDKEQFKQPEMANLSYVQLPKAASEADMAVARTSIDEIQKELISGANFDTLAFYRSEDPGSAKNGGDLGWFGEGRMVKEFWDATIALKKIGDISQPFKSQFGWHIVKLTGRKTTKDKDGIEKPEYQAKHILIKFEPSTETLAGLEQKANNFRLDAEKLGFKEAAQEYGLPVTETRPFPAGMNVPNIGQDKSLNDFAFQEKLNEISEVVSGRNGFNICQIISRTPAGYTPYTDVKDRVEKMLLREKRVELAHKRGQELADKLGKGKPFEDIAAESGKPILDTDYFNRGQFVPKIGNDPDFTGAAFKLSASNPVSKCVKARTGAYIIRFVSHQAADTTGFGAKADSLVAQTAESKQKDIWNKWLNSQKQNAKIEDYRSMYYGS